MHRCAEGTGLDGVLVIADRLGHSLALRGRAPVMRGLDVVAVEPSPGLRDELRRTERA